MTRTLPDPLIGQLAEDLPTARAAVREPKDRSVLSRALCG